MGIYDVFMTSWSGATDMVLSFDVFLDKKLKISIDEVLFVNISVVKLVTQYEMFKEAVIVGDLITVKKLH